MKFLSGAISVARAEQSQDRYGSFKFTPECSFFLDTGPADGAFARFPCVGERTNLPLPGQRLRPRLPGPSLPDATATRSPAVHHGDLQVPTHNTPGPSHPALPHPRASSQPGPIIIAPPLGYGSAISSVARAPFRRTPRFASRDTSPCHCRVIRGSESRQRPPGSMPPSSRSPRISAFRDCRDAARKDLVKRQALDT